MYLMLHVGHNLTLVMQVYPIITFRISLQFVVRVDNLSRIFH